MLDDAGIERAHVVGASMGGVIAQIIGVLHPDRVRSLTLACTSCRHHEWRRELFAEWADAVNERGMPGMFPDGMRWLIGVAAAAPLRRVRQRARARARRRRSRTRSSRRSTRSSTPRDELRFELPSVTAPTLVITGSQDTLTPLGDAEELAELIPNSRLYVLRGAAHGLMAEAPNAFNDVVLKFLDESRRRHRRPHPRRRRSPGRRGREVMLAPPGDLAVAQLAHRQAAPLDQHAVVAAAGADRPVGERDTASPPRTRGGARRTTRVRPTRSRRRRACGTSPRPRSRPTAARSPCRRPSSPCTRRGRPRARRRRGA